MRRPRTGCIRSLLVVAVAGATAACGTTVQQAGRIGGVSGGTQADGSGLGAADLGASMSPTQAGAAGPPAGGTGGTSVVSGAEGTGSSGSSPAVASDVGGAPAHAVQGTGVTARTVSVGIPYVTNGDAYNAALGAGGVTNGDPRADAQAVVDEINGHGGVAGRKLVPVFHAYDANSTEPGASQDQAACADFTEDHHVFAVLGRSSETLQACLSKAGVIHIDAGTIIGPDRRTFASLPLYFNSTLAQERMMADEVGALGRGRYFSAWDYTTGQPGPLPVKLGVLSLDTPQWDRPLRSTLLPGLAKAGHAVAEADVVRVHSPKSSAEVGQTVNDVQSAVLKFRTDGVTHVILLDANGSLTLLFAKPAQSQHYFPRLGINSATGAQALADAGVIGNDQLNGAVGLGWIPILDLPSSASADYATDASRHCLKIMRERTGNDYTSTAAATAFGICDMGYLLAAGIAGAGPTITNASVRRSLESLGPHFAPAALPGAFFGPARHDGTERGFDLHWDTDCTCAQYSGAHDIP